MKKFMEWAVKRRQVVERQSFEDWIRKVDQIIGRMAGLSYLDLADQPYRDWFDRGVSPASAAKRALSAEGFF